jgi:D-alanyl-D-alanine carboxypeptidase/D-alanyl-D-alanine-endopeptidase (penicillin-binding protein 4)
MMVRFVVLVGSLTLGGCATFGLGTSGVDRGALDKVLGDAPFDQMHVGVLAVDAQTGRTLYAHNAQRRFVPASNQKLLVTAAALSLLGPEYRFRTKVWGTAPINGSFLDGSLVVSASGDPSMSSRYWASGTAALDAIADSLRSAGVTRVSGTAFVDVSSWDSTSVGPTREADDLRYAYGSTGGAFSIDEGEVEIIVRAGPEVGSPASVTWVPYGAADFVQSRIQTSGPDSVTRVNPTYMPESRQLLLEGISAWGRVDTMSFASRDPVRQASAALWNALDRAGIEVEGGWDVAWAPGERMGQSCLSGRMDQCASASMLASLQSPTLSQLVADVLGPSQNWMAEQLVLTLGATLGDQGSWPEGMRVIDSYLIDEVGIDSFDIASRDGSGLSAYNLITPRALVQVLREMHLGPHSAPYRTAMAEPGEAESTLEDRLVGLEGRLFAKTGTISNVNSLSGYLVGENGQDVIFSILTNGSGPATNRVTQAIDELVRILAN